MSNPALTTTKFIAIGVGRGEMDPKVLTGCILVLVDEIQEINRKMKKVSP